MLDDRGFSDLHAPVTALNRAHDVLTADVSSSLPSDAVPRFIVQSPYVEPEHQIDLWSLSRECALVARALSSWECLRADYATASYLESFNWHDMMARLRDLAREQKEREGSAARFQETSFYIVVFRSTIPPSTVYADLGALDKAAHAEAVAVGGFLKYWFGSPDLEGRNLATCVWSSRPEAIKGGEGEAHRKASRATHSLYSSWKIERHRLTVKDGAETWEMTSWID